MQRLVSWLMESVAEIGPWGLFLVALADSSFVPLPQAVDALIIAHTIASPSTAYWSAALAVTGSLLGSLILYWIARGGGRVVENKASPKVVDRIRRQIEDYGVLVLLLPTMIPVPLPMAPFVIGAGLFHMKVYHFTAVIVFARSVRYFGEAFIAVRYGEQTLDFLREHTVLGVAVALLLVAFFYAAHRWSTSRLGQG